MTPKDKAIGLYCRYIDAYNDRNLQVSDYKFAKQCALIAVDEIMNVIIGSYDYELEKIYWQDVKNEILAL